MNLETYTHTNLRGGNFNKSQSLIDGFNLNIKQDALCRKSTSAKRITPRVWETACTCVCVCITYIHSGYRHISEGRTDSVFSMLKLIKQSGLALRRRSFKKEKKEKNPQALLLIWNQLSVGADCRSSAFGLISFTLVTWQQEWLSLKPLLLESDVQ